MANKMGVQVVLEAEDRARGVLDQFGNTVVDLSEKSERGMVRMETAMARTTRSVRMLALPLVSELAPALDTTVSRVASVTTGALMLSSGLTALGIAAAGVAGIVGGALLEAWRKNREEVEQFNRSLASMDLGKIDAAVATLSGKLGEQTRKLRDAEAAWDAYWAAFGGRPAPGSQGEAALVLGGGLGGPSRAAVDETLARLREARRARETAEIGAGFGAGFEELRQSRQRRGAEALSLFEQMREGAFEVPFIVDPIERAVRERRQQIRPQAELFREFGLTGPARQLEAIPERLREVMERRQRAEMLSLFQPQGEFLGFPENVGALSAEIRADLEKAGVVGFDRLARMTPAEILRERTERMNLEHEPGGEFVGFPSAGEASSIAADTDRLQRALRREPSALALGRVGILQRQEGLTRAEQAALAFQRLEAERTSALSDISLTPERRGLVEFEADVSRANLARVRAETTEVAAGFARGFQDVEDEWGQVGLRMQEVARGTADNMHRSFYEGFIVAVSGDFKRLPELSRQFGADMVRTFFQELSKLTLAPIFGSLRTGFGALGLAGATTLLPFSGASAGLPTAMAAGGGGTPSVVTMLQQQGLQVLSDPGGIGNFAAAPAAGGGGFPMMPPVPVTALLPSGGLGLVQTSGAVVPISGGLISDFLAAPLFQTAAGVVPGSSLAAITAGQALGLGAAGLGLGFTVYSALQGAPTAENILFSAASGAVSGAVGGSIIGSWFGGPGLGTAIGAVAGGIIGAGAGFLGKGGNLTHAQREAAEIARHTTTSHAFVNEINAATSLDTLYTTLRRWQTGAVGGTSSLAFDVGWRPDPDRGYPTHWNYLGLYANASPPTPKEFFARFVRGDITKFYVNVQAGVNQDARDSISNQVRNAILGKLSDLVGEVLALVDLPGLQQFLGLPIADHPLTQAAQQELAARLDVAGVRELQQFLATTAPDAPLVAQAQGRLDQLLRAEAQVPLGFETLLADGTVRRTGLPGSVVDTRAGDIAGREILTLRAEALRPFFEDDQLAESFLQRLLEIARDRHITFLSLRQAQAF